MTLNNPLTYFSATPATVHLEVLFTQDVLTCAFVATLASRFFTHTLQQMVRYVRNALLLEKHAINSTACLLSTLFMQPSMHF